MNIDPWILAFSAVTVAVTIWMGFRSAKTSKTASDFFVAGRSVSVGWNASAISGEYLSAASFMGVAGMVMSSGYDALWYPVCYACGYLFLLLFIAGPLRRFGAYTIPDFAEGRFDSPLFRKIAVVFVLFIGFFYTMPQMKGAGTTLAYIFPGLPYWAGVVLVGAVITLNVALGGMKGITLVQAFQYWIKMFAIAVPVFVLMAVYGHYGKQLGAQTGLLAPASASKPTAPEPSQSSGIVVATNTVGYVKVGTTEVVVPSAAKPVFDVVTSRESGRDPEALSRLPLPQKAPPDSTWLNPFGPLTTKAAKAANLSAEESKPYSLLYTYSIIIALVCGTAGLPHILVRFYTNPDGVAAKRTTMWVMILIGVFYVFPPVFGVIGRNLLPELYSGVGAKGTDKIVLELPRIISERYGVLGSILSGITCAGAFAAFMSTFSGLLVSMTGALAHDVYGRMLNPKATAEQRMKMFKWCAVLIGGVAVLLGSFVEPLEINFMVGQAFAIAAASYFPLLFMAVWWRKLTMKGAATGMLTGGLSALIGISLTSFSTLAVAPGKTGELFAIFKPLNDFWAAHPLLRILCEQPAIWAVPLAITLMIVVSKLTAKDIPSDIRMKMLVLHAPEKLGLKQEYIQEHQAGH
jgi:cation/acetate symporter